MIAATLSSTSTQNTKSHSRLNLLATTILFGGVFSLAGAFSLNGAFAQTGASEQSASANKPLLDLKPNNAKKSKKEVVEIKFTLDPQASSVKWQGHKVAYSHHGTVDFKSGEFVMKNGVLKSGTAVVDLNTIKDEDLTDPEYNAKLVNHLKSEDFFDVKSHPYAEFRLLGFNEVHNIIEGKPNAIVKGEFIIRGKTSKVQDIMMFYTPNENGFELTGKMSIDRTKHGLKYNSQKFFSIKKLGDKMIKDIFDLDIKVVAKKN